jgi:hypothetical protein
MGITPKGETTNYRVSWGQDPKGLMGCDGTDDAYLPSFVGSGAFGLEPVETFDSF